MKKTTPHKVGFLTLLILLSLQTGITYAETHTYGTIAGPNHVSATDDGDITAEGINGWHWEWTDPATGETYKNDYTGELTVGNSTGTETVTIQKGISTQQSDVAVHGKNMTIGADFSSGSRISVYSEGKKISLGDAGYTESMTLNQVSLAKGAAFEAKATGNVTLEGIGAFPNGGGAAQAAIDAGTVTVAPVRGGQVAFRIFDGSSVNVHATEGLDFKSPSDGSGNKATFYVQGGSASFTTDDGTVSMDGWEIRLLDGYNFETGTNNPSRVVIDGAALFDVKNTVLSTKDSDVSFGSKATGGTMQFDGVYTLGKSESTIGSAKVDKLSIDVLNTDQSGSALTLRAKDMTLGKEADKSKSRIGGSGRLTVEAGNDVTIYGAVMTNQPSYYTKEASVSITAGGDVTIDAPKSSYGSQTAVSANGGSISIVSGRDLTASGDIVSSYDSSMQFQGANIFAGEVKAGNADIVMKAVDQDGNKGVINLETISTYRNKASDKTTSIQMEGKTVNIQNAAPANPTVRSIMLNDSGSLSIKADTIRAEGYSATGGSTGELLATKKLVITRGSDNVDDFNGLDQRAAVIAAEGTQTTFGTETADVSVEGTTKVNEDAAVTFDGKTVILTATGEDAALYSQGRTRVGSDQTEETTLRGRVDAFGAGGTTVLGQEITAEDAVNAYGKVDVGSAATRTVTLEKEAAALSEEAALILTGETVDAAAGIAAKNGGSTDISAKDLNGTLKTAEEGTLSASVTGTFTGRAEDEAGTMTVTLKPGALWKNTGTSTVATVHSESSIIRPAGDASLTIGTYEGKNGVLDLKDGKGGETLTIGTYNNENGTVLLDVDPTKNYGADTLTVTEGFTQKATLSLEKTDPNVYWTNAIEGTVIAHTTGASLSSVGLRSDTEEQPLHFVTLHLGEKATDDGSDIYIDWVEKKETVNGRHTATVQNLAGIAQSHYLLWRSDMDTLHRRLGDVGQDGMTDGIWARMAGTKIRHDGEFGSEMKYEKYEVGYDFYDKATTKVRHIRGIGLSYLDGDGTYASGTSDIKGYTVGFYDTFAKDDGQYFDFTVKAQRFATEYTYSALSRSQAGSFDAKGLTIGAEYGYKIATDHGWFVEPQVQLTAGWLRQDGFTDPSGVYVDADTVGTAVYRMGTRIGYEGHRATAFARVDWYHDFSGALATHMTYGDDRLDVYDDYGDTWLEYGLGLSWKVAPDMEVHAEATRGSGSGYDKDWAFNMGIQYEF
jgi:outer membrane autotransporter protein